MINRNLAPGIVLDESERQKISERLKMRWKTGKMEDARKKSQITRKGRTYEKSPISYEKRQLISKRMEKNNPMFDENVRQKHKKSMNTKEIRLKKSEIAKGNTYTKGRSWYNNGIETKMFYQQPEGWTKGRLNPHWNHKRKRNTER